MPTLKLLQQLPSELLQDILELLERPALVNLTSSSKWCYDVAIGHIWREVELVDCKTEHFNENAEDRSFFDDHDDTPLIRKLFLLATKPWLAAQVQVLTHRCHLPNPAIFNELPTNTFSAQTLSTDPRTIELARLAVQNMKKVHTLRIVLGHPHLTDALLRCFFDERRNVSDYTRVRRLWLENCRISAGLDYDIPWHPYGLPLKLDFTGLESVRFRRLPMRPGPLSNQAYALHMSYSRGGERRSLQDGMGGRYEASAINVLDELKAGWTNWVRNDQGWTDIRNATEDPLFVLYATAHDFDERIYAALASQIKLPEEIAALGALSRCRRARMAYRGHLLDMSPEDLVDAEVPAVLRRCHLEKRPSANTALSMLRDASRTLTSLNFDWVMSAPLGAVWPARESSLYQRWVGMYFSLFSCRFPKLRSFQMRNCVVPHTSLPVGLFLLDSCTVFQGSDFEQLSGSESDSGPAALAPLAFMEAHPELQCLAWPMSSFFSNNSSSVEVKQRVDRVLKNLARNLVDLRIDTRFSENGEPFSGEDSLGDDGERVRRKRFIAELASELKSLESIKIEGGMPRDERREIVRALHSCPLQKIVTIGISSPTGNTWGQDGVDVVGLIDEHDRSNMEAEDKHIVYALGPSKLIQPADQFAPQYGWDAQPPMLHTLASYHAESVRELKFCGWKGSPILLSPTPITTPLLAPLKHFHKLESLIISLWLTTLFEGEPRDHEVISYWTDSRSPSSTALVLILDEEPEDGWDKELKTKYAPNALAWTVMNFLGPLLSEEAKARTGGVHVRASFSLGDWGGIFDLDLWIGKGSMNSDVCLAFKGPREELEQERRREKLNARRWF
ncbi:Putative F-box domain-containing protein [Septoria linicola]|uniref:F-box domain-containing protein n=1 Tax=Septoria linicola TaxID=215465 RepID=A0A9Q9AUI2_9PEZI|nr:putative F-box domain-containing protein [Septoria linicola]USW50951.1 Putative F-box domain-containing protein [Septoria linicola]